ncbi:MAG: NAD-dependent epimerase/dehydratase family protein [Nitrospinae bacterium]|nr:NAD-dependent epimerase/dehydratase family protein [Nitrospinota bacterium]MBI3815177.1 NAD-dependent epimerase/dehydratase family protein [Nitrospinota bacterium]
MIILVTGAKGMMGSDLIKVLSQKKEYNLIGATRNDFDITDYSQTLQFLRIKDLILSFMLCCLYKGR